MSSAILVICSLPLACVIIFIGFKNKTKPGAPSLIFFSLSISIVAVANLFFFRGNRESQSFWFALTYFGLSIGYTSVLTFVIQYVRYEGKLTVLNLSLLALEPLVTQVLFWLNPWRLFQITELNITGAKTLVVESPWFYINAFYTNSLLLIAIFLLVRDFNTRPLFYRFQIKFIVVGFGLSILISNVSIASPFITSLELKFIPLLATGAAFMVGVFGAGILDIVPIARESVVEHMRDGWIVLDKENRIVDINAAAEKIVGLTIKDLSGQPASKFLINWPNVLSGLNDTREIDIKGSVKRDDDWIYLSIHISTLTDENNNDLGKLIVWRDITGRRLADDARQRARDDMFILLHSITSAASRALNLDDFLSESIYQIVYSSHSQSIAVYLFDEPERPSRERNLVLTAHHGIPISHESQMNSIPIRMEMVSQVLENNEVLLIPDIQTDRRVPEPMRALGNMCMLLIPMQVEGKALGLLSLTRSSSPIYSPDEIARLSAVADEIATFVQSNRQRQLSIALAERQRLVRDLHDSVSQKLYGLVTLAEATQAGIQAGVTDMPAQVIGRMAENARQALKEMRLFLYQMQPVDFEREGLVEVLQHRLAAVEGRADIITRLHTDEDFSLPVDLEIALYFIAQEALNNVLKHAKAKTVNIFLKKTRSTATLEVEDNGCGFDPKKLDSGGIGMRSMKERTAKIGGKLKIVSAPGKGTKVSVSVKNVMAPEE